MAAKEKAQKIIDTNPVAVFSKSYCPYCKKTKQLLSESGAKFYLIELDEVGMYSLSIITVKSLLVPLRRILMAVSTDDGADIQAALEELTGQRSVPNIFIGQKHIGGNSDLQGKKDELPTLLKDAGAV